MDLSVIPKTVSEIFSIVHHILFHINNWSWCWREFDPTVGNETKLERSHLAFSGQDFQIVLHSNNFEKKLEENCYYKQPW